MTDRDSALQLGLFPSTVGDRAERDVGDLERMREALERSGRYVVLRMLQGRDAYADVASAPPGRLRRGVYLDVETTGLDSSDTIIELAMVSFEYDDAGLVYRILDRFDEFEDPGVPLSKEITQLTGITTDDVRGKRLPEDRVSPLVEAADLVIAHNAAFDRPKVEQRLPMFREKAWACSVEDVDWHRHGFAGRNLEYLAMKRGFVFEGHRAINDCLAGLELLTMPLPANGGPPTMANLLANAARSGVRLWAEGSPFDTKDLLKARSYRWNAAAKTWWRDLASEDHDSELEWLAANVYPRRRPLPFFEITADRRYSARIPDAPGAGTPRR